MILESFLKNKLEILSNLKFTKYVDNEDLSEWIFELSELDSYYAGLAASVCSGIKIDKKKILDLADFEKKLHFIEYEKLNTTDKKNYKICEKYLEIFKAMNEEFKKSYPSHSSKANSRY